MFSTQTHMLIKLFILIAALAVISAGMYLARRNGKPGKAKIADYALVALAGFSLMNYLSFMPFSAKPHTWDMFHYYIGSKYFEEIGYTRLYACVVRAEAESGNVSIRTRAYERNITDLTKDSSYVPARNYFYDDAFCKARFSAPRWNNFKDDVFFFHARLGSNFDGALLDHGFNASPVWTLAGGFVSNAVPLSDRALMWIKQIDIVFLFGGVACLIWAFGLSTASFAVIAFTALEMVSWKWCGNSLLRFDWFFLAILSVCAMKRGYHIVAGLALGYAAALRIFPAVFAIGPFVGMLYAYYRRDDALKIAYGKFFGGMIISVTVLVISASAVYGKDSIMAFIDNSKKHSAAFMANNVGLRTVLAYNTDLSERNMADRSSPDQIKAWVEAKTEAKQHTRFIYFAVVAVALLLFIPAVVSGGAWQALALGASFVPFAWVELSNYYYVFLAVTATLYSVNRRVAFPLLGIGIVSSIGMLTMVWQDEVYVLFSAVTCIGFLVVWRLVRNRRGVQPGAKHDIDTGGSEKQGIGTDI